jgi:hypothetical protein
MGRYWREWLQERFGDRSALPRDEAVQRFWSNLPPEDLADFFEMIETEYGLDVGLLRPDDNIARFTTPIKTKNPLRWFAVEPSLEDRASELNHQIVQRADEFGLAQYLPVHTIGDYVRVWCGRAP